MQSKKHSFIEANLNTATGFIISLLLAYFLLPYFGTKQDIMVSLEITGIYTLVSIARNYVVRRIFNRRARK